MLCLASDATGHRRPGFGRLDSSAASTAASEHISLLPLITFTTMRARTPNCDDKNKCCTLRKLHAPILSSLTFTNFRSPSNLTTNFTETNLPMLLSARAQAVRGHREHSGRKTKAVSGCRVVQAWF